MELLVNFRRIISLILILFMVLYIPNHLRAGHFHYLQTLKQEQEGLSHE